ncbi:alpha/beta hydrolase [Nonlabens sp. SCSIO 43208]|uniref:alpha/beta hydrolase n=1 Tax=Nonlabens sp. SCSIO 43208 TaxID=2793009 RepID=UPI003D6B7275
MKYFLVFTLFIVSISLNAQDVFSKGQMQKEQIDPTIYNINDNIQGSLLVPDTLQPVPLVIFIAGQGAVDRNGNEPRTRSNHYKQLADSLLSKGIASYRYDKRTLTLMKNRKTTDEVTLNTFITDARVTVKTFNRDDRFSKIYLLGHGQGSLIAMRVYDESISGVISIAGHGQSIDDLIVDQISKEIPGLDKVARATFDKIKKQEKPVKNIERDLWNVANPGIQPFMKSWMKYDPTKLIKKIECPILLLNGDKNRQVSTMQTELLHEASPSSKKVIITGMNYVFKKVGDDEIVAAKSYVEPNFPIHPELINQIHTFVTE